MMTATYSPEDNKLRLYSVARLAPEDYARVRAHGFICAAKQDLFVAPKWTPEREDLLIEMVGDIVDEDTSLVERAEVRAERFGEYKDNRAKDARSAEHAVSKIIGGIPLGQPIMIGHHSERHARKDQERIDSGVRRAVNMWKTSEYWRFRAAGALRHAKYKELPSVRARRIKTLEAEKRVWERAKANAEQNIALWEKDPDRIDAGTMALTLDRALAITNRIEHGISACFPLALYPRAGHTYEGLISLWSALTDGICTPEQARIISLRAFNATIKCSSRWIEHYDNRLTYETAMLEEQGASDLIAPKPRIKSAKAALPLLNYQAENGITVENRYRRGETIHYPQVQMTSKQYTGIPNDYRSTHVVGNSHRIRTCMGASARSHGAIGVPSGGAGYSIVCVFLTDSKAHPVQDPAEKPKSVLPQPPVRVPQPLRGKTEAEQRIEALSNTRVEVAVAPHLFPTPDDTAKYMVELANIQEGDRVLEPSAGTGALACQIVRQSRGSLLCVELNHNLANRLQQHGYPTICGNFLDQTADSLGGLFDRIVMNPPFDHGSDIRHIQHALTLLRPGGRLIAICANGPRQRDAFEEVASIWTDLAEGTFKDTNVRAAIVVINKDCVG